MSIDLTSFELAEALYQFVQQESVYTDFCCKSKEHNLSIAEYIQQYQFHEFELWYMESAYNL